MFLLRVQDLNGQVRKDNKGPVPAAITQLQIKITRPGELFTLPKRWILKFTKEEKWQDIKCTQYFSPWKDFKVSLKIFLLKVC